MHDCTCTCTRAYSACTCFLLPPVFCFCGTLLCCSLACVTQLYCPSMLLLLLLLALALALLLLVPAGKFFWFLLFMTQTLLYFTYYGVMCVALTPNLLMAAVASNSLYLTMNLFSGFVIPAPVSHLLPLPLPLPLLCSMIVLLQLLVTLVVHLRCRFFFLPLILNQQLL